ncbi:Erythronate-4-phosphate dehydrogenase [hydrothermal vent metagenome]|uniref:Erythronate-4-phosphate dehydrogenase n=1 Tax=hydrothermal vent metagenome TaxID=652676 RepID=A0A3B0ZZH8_9ZZZZ
MKIFADQNIPFATEAFSTLSTDAEVVLFDGRAVTNEQLLDADILMVRSVTKVNKTLLTGSKIKFVGSATIGTDHIDLEYLDSENIPYANAPGCNATSASEYVVCGLLNHACLNNVSLSAMKVAVVGYGNVGSRVVQKLNALDINTFIYDPPRSLLHEDVDYVDWQQVKSCNVITAHVPLTTQGDYPTSLMFNAEFFAALAEDSLFINTSRGAAVDEAALLKQLETKKINLLLDVWQNEPVIDTTLLSKTEISTPHIAGYSFDGKLRGTEMIYRAACQQLNVQATWDPSLVLASETKDNILHYAAQGIADVAGLYSLLNEVYSIEADSQRLIDTMTLDAEQRAQQFDLLRKHYPVRREFSYYRVSSGSISAKEISLLAKLGFNMSL